MRTGLLESSVRAALTYNFYRKALIAIALGALAVGCATTDPPEREMAAARATVAQARSFAGEGDAAAPLVEAQAKLARAEVGMQRGNYEQARILAEQAQADARLALTIAENARNQRALREEQGRRGQ